jgi:hypothetical protein
MNCTGSSVITPTAILTFRLFSGAGIKKGHLFRNSGKDGPGRMVSFLLNLTKALLIPGELNGQVIFHLTNLPIAPPSSVANAY